MCNTYYVLCINIYKSISWYMPHKSRFQTSPAYKIELNAIRILYVRDDNWFSIDWSLSLYKINITYHFKLVCIMKVLLRYHFHYKLVKKYIIFTTKIHHMWFLFIIFVLLFSKKKIAGEIYKHYTPIYIYAVRCMMWEFRFSLKNKLLFRFFENLIFYS